MTTVIPEDICPACGGPLVFKQVEKLLRGGANTAAVQVGAEVCQRCGEHLYTTEAIRRFEDIRAKLSRRETAGFTPLGQSFEVALSPDSATH